jgi:hypothetical protein
MKSDVVGYRMLFCTDLLYGRVNGVVDIIAGLVLHPP